MDVDLTKLTPAPWFADDTHLIRGATLDREAPDLAKFRNPDDCAFTALARQAFDVMLRRGWGVERIWNNDLRIYRWYIVTDAMTALREGFSDPFTAIMEADRWMTEQEARDGR